LVRLFSGGNTILIIVIAAAVAAILSIVSYQYSSYNANQILHIASEDVRSNAKIQSHDLSTIVEQELDKITAVLQTLASSPAIHNAEIERGREIINLRQETTSDITDGYFWLDRDGKLVWSSKFASDESLYAQFQDTNLADQSYFTIPRTTQTTYYSSIIESIDGDPRVYISMPIVGNNGTLTDFKGVIVAGIRTDTLGNFVRDQIPPGFESNVGLVDKNSIILYTTNQTYIGKNYYGSEFQSTLTGLLFPNEINALNEIIKHSLQGSPGTDDITVRGQLTTIAYTPITINGEHLLTLYITSPHQLTGSVSSLIDQQRNFNIVTVVVISAVAAGIAILILMSNKRLTETVKLRTSELKIANESLAESNKQLQTTNSLLSEANEQLKTHDKMQKEFINIAAHELRTPTQAILGYSELMEHANPQDVKAAAAAILRNANRLKRLTDDILDITRIESQSLNLTMEEFDLNEKITNVIQDTKSSSHHLINGGTTEIIFERSAQDLHVYGDKVRIFQVLSNLLRNAMKFTRNGNISIKAEQKDGYAIVNVKDNGTGIDPEIMPRLFTKFASKSQTGTGLGLFISKSIIEAHGGKIWAENNKDGRGATFGFTLPIAKSSIDSVQTDNDLYYSNSARSL
jgi:signal transduction histidine kinase